MNTAAAIAQALAEAGIKKVFGLPGGEVLVLIDELRKAGVDFVLMRHEANAGIAAAVYGKLNRQPGRRHRHAWAGRGQPAAADRERVPRSGAAAGDHRADSRTIFPPSHTHQLLPLHDTFRPMCRVVDEDHAVECGRCDRSGAGRVHGSAVRRVVPDAVGARSVTKPLLRSAAKYHEGPPTRPMANPAARAADLRARCAMAERPLVLVGLGVEPERAPSAASMAG